MADYRYLNSYLYCFQLHLLSSYSHMYSVMLLLTFLFSPERTCTSLGSLPLFHPTITPTAHLTTTLFYYLPTDTVQFLLTFSILYYRYYILSQDSHGKHHNYSARETSTSVFHIFLVWLISFISLQLLQLCRSPLFCDILLIMLCDDDNSQQSGWKKSCNNPVKVQTSIWLKFFRENEGVLSFSHDCTWDPFGYVKLLSLLIHPLHII